MRLAIAILSLWPAVAVAQNHAFQGQLAASAGVTDNANLAEEGMAVSDGFSSLSPSVIYARTGLRMIQLFTYQFTAQVYFEHSEANSYSNRAAWLGMFALSRDVRLDFAAEANQGESNNFDIVAEPGIAQPTQGGVSFLSTSLTQALLWQVTPAWSAREDVTLRLLLPLGETTQATGYSISNLLESDRSWRRTAVGGRYRTSFFITEERTADDGSALAEGQQQLITGPEAVVRRDLGDAWSGELSAGIVGAMRVDAFSETGLILQPTGAAIARFNTQRGGASVGYSRTVAPNLLVGEVFLNDSVQASADYPLLVEQRVTLRGGGALQRLAQVGVEGESIGGPSYAYLADASVNWQPTDSLSLSLRYQFRRQDGDEESSLEDLTANTVVLSVGGSYPSASATRGLDPRRSSSRVDGADGGDPFGLDPAKSGNRPR